MHYLKYNKTAHKTPLSLSFIKHASIRCQLLRVSAPRCHNQGLY